MDHCSTNEPIKVGAFMSSVITFTMFEAAYYCEIMRAGIQSIPRGQVWAGYALGLNYWQTMGNIVLPQAFRNMLPVLLTQTIILFQDTSLVYVMSVTDFLGAATKVAQPRRPAGGDVHLRRRGVLHHQLSACPTSSSGCRCGWPCRAKSDPAGDSRWP